MHDNFFKEREIAFKVIETQENAKLEETNSKFKNDFNQKINVNFYFISFLLLKKIFLGLNENNLKITNKPVHQNERRSYLPLQGNIRLKLPKEMIKFKTKENLSKKKEFFYLKKKVTIFPD